MCTVIKRTQMNRPKTAKKDIVVYKCGNRGAMNYMNFVTPFQGAVYELYRLYSAEFKINHKDLVSDDFEALYRNTIPEKDRRFVITGFHSYKSIERSKKKS